MAGYEDPFLQRLHRALSVGFEAEAAFTRRVAVRQARGRTTEQIASAMEVPAARVRAATKRLDRVAGCSDIRAALLEDLDNEAKFTMEVGVRRALDQSVEGIALQMGAASDAGVTVADVRGAVQRLQQAREAMAA